MWPSCVRFPADGAQLYPRVVPVGPSCRHTVRSPIRIPSQHGNAAHNNIRHLYLRVSTDLLFGILCRMTCTLTAIFTTQRHCSQSHMAVKIDNVICGLRLFLFLIFVQCPCSSFLWQRHFNLFILYLLTYFYTEGIQVEVWASVAAFM